MKKIRLLFLTLVALIGAVSASASKTVYIQPNAWSNDGAVISVNVWQNGVGGNEWVSLTEVETGILKATFDDKFDKMAILRAKEGYGNKWKLEDGTNVWNQSGDISITDGKLYSINSGSWDGAAPDNGITVSDYSEPVAVGYTCDFNTEISTSTHDFVVAPKWRHIVDDNEGYYVTYKWDATYGDGSGALMVSTQRVGQSYYYMTNVYDMLVTPKVSGTIKLKVKATSSVSSSTNYNAYVQLWSLNATGTEKDTQLKEFRTEIPGYNDNKASEWVELTYEVGDTPQRIGIRAQYVYIDYFSADEIDTTPETALSVSEVMNGDGATGTNGTNPEFEQQPDGNMKVILKVTLTNTGDVDFVAGSTANYTLTPAQASYTSGEKTYYEDASIAIPEDLAAGETKTFNVEFSVPYLSGFKYWYVRENVTGTTSSSNRYATSVAYASKFVLREAGSSSTTDLTGTVNYGKISIATPKSFEIYNDGTGPLTIKSITLPTGFTCDNLPVIPTEGLVVGKKSATASFDITLPMDVTGVVSGNLVIVYDDAAGAEQTKTVPFTGNVLTAGQWFADFDVASSSDTNYPAGAVAESGIRFGTTYISSGNYDGYLYSYTSSSYATENNKFITPKLHAAAGDKLTFDVRRDEYSSSTYNLKVYVSADRVNWGEPVYSETAANLTADFQTQEITFETEGDYYVAFAIYGVRVDNLVGLTKVDVAHDLYIKEVSWPDASIKSGTAQTKPSVTIIPLTNEDAANYTVKYIYGETVLGEGTSVALPASATSTKDIAINWTPNVANTTVYENTKVVFEFTDDGTKFETETFDLTVTNEPIFHFLNAKPSSKWNEPTDRTADITFGKTNTADTQSFVIFNWGSANLNVKSISLPAGFSTTTEFPLVVTAFNGENDGIDASSQALDITFSAAEAGNYSGDMVITYVNGAGEDATFQLPISGTKLDPTLFYANFDDGGWPAGSIYQGSVSSTNGGTYSAPNYYISSSSATNNLFITPKLTATAGDKLAFDAKLYNSYWSEGKVVVYAAATRDELVNFDPENDKRTKLFSVSGEDAENPMTIDYQTFEVPALEGDYYYAFEISNNPRVDEIYGLTPVAVAHDWQIASSNIPTEGMQNNSYAATVNVLNLGIADEDAADYTVTAYVDYEAAGTGTPVAIPMSHQLTAAGTQLSVSFVYPKAGTFPVYLKVESADGTYNVATAPVDVTFAPEEAKSEANMATNGTTFEVPLYLNYKNSESVTMYNAEALAAAGISAGTKIKKITYKGYKTTDEQTTSFQVYYKWTDDQTLSQPATTYPFAAAEDGMTKLIDEDHTWAKVGAEDNLGEMIVLDFTGSPLTYETGKSLVIYMHSYVDGYKTAYFEKSTLSSDYCYTRRADAATLSSAFSKAVPAAIHFTLDATTATLSGIVKNSSAAGIEGATITLKAANGVEYSGTTAADGSYSINVIQAGLDFTATVEKDGYLKKQFDLKMGGASKTNDVVMYTKMGIVGDAGLGLDWDNDQVMTQSTEDPNIFTLTVKGVGIAAAATYEYKLRADGAWNLTNKYELPNVGNQNWEFGTTMYPTGTYNLIFTANTTAHTLTLQPVLQLTLADSQAPALDYENAPADVTVGRTLKAGWNAMVLPFDVTAEEIAAQFGANAQVAEFTGDEKNDDKVSVNFAKSDVITANVPFLLYLEAAPGEVKFLDKSVTFAAEPKVAGTKFDFVGLYADGTSTTIADGDYIMAGGMLKCAAGGNAINAYRSYLKLKEAPQPARISIFMDGELIGEAEGIGEATGIQGIGVKQAEGLYNMGGQKVTGRTKKGVYIQNGKKVVIK